MAELRIDTRSEEDVAQLLLTGEFDLAGIQYFEDALAKVERQSPGTILVDLSGLEFMDSSGLRALVSADDRARKVGRRFAIVPGPAQVRRVFEITQVEQRLDLVDSGASL